MSVNASSEMMSKVTDVGASDADEKSLYKIGGAAALLCALMYFIALVIYIPAYRVGPPPGTVLEWFALFQADPVTGLFFLGLADVVIMFLWVGVALALYAALKQSNRTWSRIATAFVFVGIAVFLATNTAFSMLYLSHQYAAATTDAQKSIVLAAGQAIIAISEGTGGRMPLAGFAGLIISIVMLGSKTFSKATAWAGILGFGLLLASAPFAGYATTGPMSTVVSAIVTASYAGGGLLSLAWYILVGRRLLQLGRVKPGGEGE
jgi:hypothetical protein